VGSLSSPPFRPIHPGCISSGRVVSASLSHLSPARLSACPTCPANHTVPARRPACRALPARPALPACPALLVCLPTRLPTCLAAVTCRPLRAGPTCADRLAVLPGGPARLPGRPCPSCRHAGPTCPPAPATYLPGRWPAGLSGSVRSALPACLTQPALPALPARSAHPARLAPPVLPPCPARLPALPVRLPLPESGALYGWSVVPSCGAAWLACIPAAVCPVLTAHQPGPPGFRSPSGCLSPSAGARPRGVVRLVGQALAVSSFLSVAWSAMAVACLVPVARRLFLPTCHSLLLLSPSLLGLPSSWAGFLLGWVGFASGFVKGGCGEAWFGRVTGLTSVGYGGVSWGRMGFLWIPRRFLGLVLRFLSCCGGWARWRWGTRLALPCLGMRSWLRPLGSFTSGGGRGCPPWFGTRT
jgi:hypothetical protein